MRTERKNENKLHVTGHFNSINKNFINNIMKTTLTTINIVYREHANKYKQIRNKPTYLWSRDNKNSYRNRNHELSRGPLSNHR